MERSDTHHLSMRAVQDDGFRKGSTHPTGLSWKIVCFFYPPQNLQALLSDSNVVKSKEIGIEIVSDENSEAVTFVWDTSDPENDG